MSDDRLSPRLEAHGFIRLAEAAGGHGMILQSGDDDRGAITLILVSRGAHFSFLERQLTRAGRYEWQAVGPDAQGDAQKVSEWIARRRSFDTDSWLIELDVPDPQRFIAETVLIG